MRTVDLNPHPGHCWKLLLKVRSNSNGKERTHRNYLIIHMDCVPVLCVLPPVIDRIVVEDVGVIRAQVDISLWISVMTAHLIAPQELFEAVNPSRSVDAYGRVFVISDRTTLGLSAGAWAALVILSGRRALRGTVD